MFELPGAKRVRREELKSPDASRSPSPSGSFAETYAADALRHVFSSLETFTPPNIDTSSRDVPDQTAEDGGVEEEFEFRLFYAPPTEKEERNDVQKLKIRLRSPTPTGIGEGGFVVPFRGWNYYLSDPERVLKALDSASSNEKDITYGIKVPARLRYTESFLEAAVSGEDVLARAASTPWPGCSFPWRVIRVQPTAPTKSSSKTQQPEYTRVGPDGKPLKRKKSKPGKKRRIVLRQRLASQTSKEQAEKEKRARRNREKKLKRRQKERDKKAAMKGVAGSMPGGDNDGGGQSDGDSE